MDVTLGAGVAIRNRDRWDCLSAGVGSVMTHFDRSDDEIPPALAIYATYRHIGYNSGGPVLRLYHVPSVTIDGAERSVAGVTVGWQWGMEPTGYAVRDIQNNADGGCLRGLSYLLVGGPLTVALLAGAAL